MHLFPLCAVLTLYSMQSVFAESDDYGGLGMIGGLGQNEYGYGETLASGESQPMNYADGHAFDAAIHSKRTVSVIPVHENYEEPKINVVSVDAAEVPLVLTLKSKSSPLIVNAVHIGSEKGSIKKTKSVDPAHIRVHSIYKPILHKVQEILQPHR